MPIATIRKPVRHGLPHLPAEGEAGEEQHADGDGVGKPQGEPDIVDEEERHGDRKQAQKDEQEDADGGQIIFPAKPDLEALGRQAAQMETDALEVRAVRAGKTAGGRLSATIALPTAELSASRIAWTVEMASRRSPRAPIRYMTASMIAQARLQPSMPMSTARTSARPASVAARERVKVRTMMRPNRISLARDTGSSTLRDAAGRIAVASSRAAAAGECSIGVMLRAEAGRGSARKSHRPSGS